MQIRVAGSAAYVYGVLTFHLLNLYAPVGAMGTVVSIRDAVQGSVNEITVFNQKVIGVLKL